ncbi:PREDICTED: uncharacterized protein LOC109472524 [Branchiostoma belcheri]|uniref:Uncharacterized protein LOC109472524 n=1 Tax=Branchiostoma belcheri TaxID=7741 RepID=A0A6P4ZE00_BRABE|nr:PREDICTED: uncharacterized protein LOC109472524 [Branchiostoma belcheri]
MSFDANKRIFELQAFSILQHVKKEYRCGDCSFCIDYDLMVQVLRHHFNCTSAKYVNILSQGITQHHGHSYGDAVANQPAAAQSDAKIPDAHEREQTVTIHHHPASTIQKSPFRPSSLNAAGSLAGSDASFTHPVMLSAEDHATSQVQQASSAANRQTMIQESPGERQEPSVQPHAGAMPHHTQSPPSPNPGQRRLSASTMLQWKAVSSPDTLKWGGGLYVKQEPSELSGVMPVSGDHMHTPHSQQRSYRVMSQESVSSQSSQSSSVQPRLTVNSGGVGPPTAHTAEEEGTSDSLEEDTPQVINSPAYIEDDDDDDVVDVPEAGSPAILQHPLYPQLVRHQPMVITTDVSAGSYHHVPNQRLTNPYPAKKTIQMNHWAMRTLCSWAAEKAKQLQEQGAHGSFQALPKEWSSASPEELNYWLCQFVVETRRKDGQHFPPKTIYHIMQSISRYLTEECGRTDTHLLARHNATYRQLQDTLYAEMKRLEDLGLGSVNAGKHMKEGTNLTFSDEEEAYFWNTKVFDLDCDKGLITAVFYYNCKLLGLRSIQDHRSLHLKQFVFGLNADGTCQYMDIVHPTGRQRLIADPTNARCLVKLYHSYVGHLPVSSGPFYRRPLKDVKNISFSIQPVGVNQLSNYMCRLRQLAAKLLAQKHNMQAAGSAAIVSQ